MKKPEGWPYRRIAVLVSTAVAWGLAWTERLMAEAFQLLPWFQIACLLTAFVLGGVAADLTNPTSWVRRWLKWKRRSFDVLDVRRWELIPIRTIIDL